MVEKPTAKMEKAQQAYKAAVDTVLVDLSSETDEHEIPLEELFTRLKVDPQVGLSQEEAVKRNKIYGLNILSTPKEIKGGCCITLFSSKAREDKKKKKQDLIAESESLIVTKRDRIRFSVPAADLTVGDIILINQDDKIPADVRVIASTGCVVDNKDVTMEADPVRLSEVCESLSDGTKVSNVAFMRARCVSGQATCVVIRIGNQTVAGRIQYLLQQKK